ncbi:uncharacterized protein V1518DRAFT_387547 [Limtongia smithiae]|uniref:uncharacterized protein n=1 Tax=Limtongia smithiae TaxID=1125753 RepID=UPI0034CEC2C6
MRAAPSQPFDASPYVPTIDAILRVADLERISARRIRNGIQELFDVDLTSLKKEVDAVIIDRFNRVLEEIESQKLTESAPPSKLAPVPKPKPQKTIPPSVKRENLKTAPTAKTSSALSSSSSSASPAVAKTGTGVSDAEYAAQVHRELNSLRGNARVTRVKRASSEGLKRSTKKRKIDRTNPFNARMTLSPQLQEFLGETALSRPESVKAIWAYIKEHNLQNPNDKREIICDDRMRPVFGNKVHMFTMNKILSNHLYPRDTSNDEDGRLSSSKVNSEDDDEDAEDEDSSNGEIAGDDENSSYADITHMFH